MYLHRYKFTSSILRIIAKKTKQKHLFQQQDTEGSFMVERVVEIANALVQHLTAVTESLNNNNNNNNSNNNNNNNNNNSNNNDSKNNERDKILKTKLPAVEDILAHIYYYRVTDYIEQIALINILHEVLQKYRKVKLIVIDSITFHFRHDFDDLRVRYSFQFVLISINEKYEIEDRESKKLLHFSCFVSLEHVY
jgi:RAD51-like protein 2